MSVYAFWAHERPVGENPRSASIWGSAAIRIDTSSSTSR